MTYRNVQPKVTTPAILATAQDLTAAYVDVGDEIDVKAYNRLGVYVGIDANSSEDVDLKVLGKHASGGDEYEVDGIDVVRLWSGSGTDINKYYEIDSGTLRFCRLQAMAGTLGVTPAFLTGGTSAQGTFGTWAAVSDASFGITIDGTAYNIDAIDFSGDGDMDAVAATLQAAIRVATGALETVTWSTNKFIISSVLTEQTSAVTVTSTSTGTVGTDISGAGAADWMDADTGNGTPTAVSGVAGNLSITIDKKWRD